MITIIPNMAYNNASWVANQGFLPFVSVSSGSTTLPFAVAPFNMQSPFANQRVNATTFAIDSVQIDFIET